MILSCNNISKSFGTDIIIKSCSFNIEDHEKAAIVGINGAGKSTLMKVLTGIYTKDSGTITYEGKEVEFYRMKNAGHGDVAFWTEKNMDLVETFIRKYL